MNYHYIRPLALAILGVTAAFPQPIPLNPLPSRAVGHPQLGISTSSPNLVEGREMYNPLGIAVDTGVTPPILYVADSFNNRILAWKSAAEFATGAPADLIIGQKDRYSTFPQGPGTSFSVGFNTPTGLAVRNRALYVVDSGNNRIMRFPNPFAQTDLFPDLVVGQPNFNSRAPNYTGQVSARGIALAGGSSVFSGALAFDNNANGNLYVLDPGNRRILRFPRIDSASGNSFQDGKPLEADLEIGQFDFTTVDPLPVSGGTVANTNVVVRDRFFLPNALAFDPQGNLFVSDQAVIGRVLVFRPPFASNMAASRIMGIITDAAANQNSRDRTVMLDAEGIFALPGNGGMAVIDAGSNRILIFDPLAQWPSEDTTLSPLARAVVGQTDFNNRNPNNGQPAPLGSTLFSPFAAAMTPTELYVADSGNNRVVALPFAAGIFSPATRVLGQDRIDTNAPNLIEGREFQFTTLARNGSLADAGMVVDTVSDPPHLYVADPYNHRVLGFLDSRRVRPGDKADIVIGQPDFSTSQCNYPSNSIDRPTQSSLCRPVGLAVDSTGNLYVADSANGRVLRFPTPFARQGVLPQADLVLGQPGFAIKFTDPTPRTMAAPYGLAFTGETGLAVSDIGHNRVLYFPRVNGEFTNGQSATKVIGQSDFSSVSTGTADNRFSAPRHIAADSDSRIYVADTGNSRVLIFDQILSLPNADAHAGVTLSGTSQPRGVYVSPRTGEIWTTGAAGSAVRYNRFDQLLLSTSPTAGVAAPGLVLAVAQDQYGNLFAADSTNRIGVYFPGLVALNGATLLPKPLAPGMLGTIKPAGQQFGADTATNTDLPNPFPLPTDLADLQVLINGAPVPLFFVSPGQINFQVPMGISAPAQVDVTVVRKSTGQILGVSSVSTDVASPAILFTGSGNVLQAVVTNADGKPNSTTNPAPIGSVISIFATGQGFVENAPKDGTPAAGETPTPEKPRVFILPCYTDDCEEPDDGITYSGLAPQLVGVWQINVRIPKKVVAAPQVPVILQYKGRFSQDPGGARTVIAVKAAQ